MRFEAGARRRVTSRADLSASLKEGGRSATTGTRTNQARNSLVVTEIALALVLLVGAGLLLKSYARVQNIDPGFDRRLVLTAEIVLPLWTPTAGR